MKSSLIFSILFLMFAVQSFGQNLTSKGTYSLNGTISFTSYSQEGVANNTTMLNFNPGVDYFIIDNFSLGLSVNIQEISYGGSSNTAWAVGPSARFYLGKEHARPFFLIGYAYGKQNSSVSGDDLTESDIRLGTGLDYFLTDNVAIESIISYTFMNVTYPAEYSLYYVMPSHEVQTRVLAIGIGVNVFLR
jgi:opacity protein-like surface antigen